MALLPTSLPQIAPGANKIRVLVADDEGPARQRLLDLLRNQPRVSAVIEADAGAAAVRAIEEQKPDLVFLDVQMPEMDGLSVMEAVGADAMPLTVFVTAYDEHAVRAFEANALDYLLKPFSDERFEATMARVRTRFDERSMDEFYRGLARLMQGVELPAGKSFLDRLVVKAGGATRFLRVTDIDWIEAAGTYVNLHLSPQAGGKEILYRAALSDLAARLDPARFLRVHRSTVVNLDSILQLEPVSHGEFDVVLKGGARVRISRSYRTLLEQRLGQSL